MIKNIMMTLSLLMICNSSLATDINVDTTPTVDYKEGFTVITIKDEGHDLVTLLNRSLYRDGLYQDKLEKIRSGKLPKDQIDLSKKRSSEDNLKKIYIINNSETMISTDDIQKCINEFPEIEEIKIKQKDIAGIGIMRIQVDQKTVSIQRGLEGDITVIAVDTRPRNRMNTTFLNGESNMDTGRINRAFTPKSHNNPLEKK